MKEQDNTTLIKTVYAAFASGNVPAILGYVTETTHWIFEAPANVPFSGTRKGPAEIAGFFAGLDSSCKDMDLVPEQFIAQGDIVITFGRFRAVAKATGIAIDVPYAHYFRIRDGKIAYYVNLSDTAALSAAFGSTAAAGR